jgi:hypothetical protein
MRKLIIAASAAVVLLAGASLYAHDTGRNGEVNVERKVLKNGVQLTITSDDAQTAEELKKADPDNGPHLNGHGYGMHYGGNYADTDCHGYGRGRSRGYRRGHMGY